MAEYTAIGVVGGGTMGSGIAYEALRNTGAKVIVRDVNEVALANAQKNIERYVSRPVTKGQMTPDQGDALLKRVTYTTEFAAFAQAEIVVEAVFEDLDLKREVFAQLSAVCHDSAILASNTSGMSITSIAAASAHPGRVIGLHFFNPVPAMKLVEIIRALQTTDETVARAEEFCHILKKETVLAKDYPGFITTRIGMAMLAEAVRCFEEGVGTAKDIDTAIKLGYNFPMGPLELADLVGIDVLLHILEANTHLLGERFKPSPLLRNMVAAGRLGRKSGHGFYEY